MKYQWLEEEIVASDIEALAGKIKRIEHGRVTVGYEEDMPDAEGNPTMRPITKRGIEIEFEANPSQDKLESLDRKFMGLKREGGKDLAQELDDLKAKVNELEKKQGGVP